jgi:hypothetical protein
MVQSKKSPVMNQFSVVMAPHQVSTTSRAIEVEVDEEIAVVTENCNGLVLCCDAAPGQASSTSATLVVAIKAGAGSTVTVSKTVIVSVIIDVSTSRRARR